MATKAPIMYHDGCKWKEWHCFNNQNDNIAILVGGGPSLNNIDISKLKGPGKAVFGLNTTYPTVIPDYWIGMDDPKCYSNHLFFESFPKILRGNFYDKKLEGKTLKEYPNTYFASVKETKRKSDIFYNMLEDAPAFSWHKNVFITAINIILYMGYRKIYLAGVDFSLDSQDYFNPKQVLTKEEKRWNQNLYNTLYKYVDWLYNTGRFADIEIKSISPNSKINTIVPYISLEEANKSIKLPDKNLVIHSSKVDAANTTINILTTATPRKELHLKGLLPTIMQMSSLDKNINWFVNIDTPDQTDKEEAIKLQESLKDIESLIPNLKIYSEVVSFKNFNTSAKNLFLKCKNTIAFNENNVFFWLEDDWMLVKQEEFFIAFKEFLSNKYSYVMAGLCNYVSGNPFLFQKDFFNTVVSIYENIETTDPEVVFFKASQSLNQIPNHRTPPQNSLYIKKGFIDIGRDWRAEKNIIKEDKWQHCENTWKV